MLKPANGGRKERRMEERLQLYAPVHLLRKKLNELVKEAVAG